MRALSFEPSVTYTTVMFGFATKNLKAGISGTSKAELGGMDRIFLVSLCRPMRHLSSTAQYIGAGRVQFALDSPKVITNERKSI